PRAATSPCRSRRRSGPRASGWPSTATGRRGWSTSTRHRRSTMGWLDRLLTPSSREEAGSAAVRRIASELATLPPQQARVLAGFAYLLGRVANADDVISDAESARMEELVREVGGVPAEQATLVVEIAKAQNRLLGHVENFRVSHELRELADEAWLRRLLDCLFAVAAEAPAPVLAGGSDRERVA